MSADVARTDAKFEVASHTVAVGRDDVTQILALESMVPKWAFDDGGCQ